MTINYTNGTSLADKVESAELDGNSLMFIGKNGITWDGITVLHLDPKNVTSVTINGTTTEIA